MSLKFTIIGESGQLARALKRQALKRGHSVQCYDRHACDLASEPDVLKQFIRNLPQTDVVFLAAAYTSVDLAETEKELAFAVNGIAPTVIAKACKARDIPLVHFSTDYVFDGKGSAPYPVDYPTGPLSVYGESKLAGERGIIESKCRAAILRTSWVFDGTGKNFMTTMLRLANDRDYLKVVNDQIGRPTYAGHLADAAITVGEGLCAGLKGSSNVFHVSGTGEPTSWAGFAINIFERAGLNVQVEGIPSSEYVTPAARPSYSVVDTSGFEQTFFATLPSWRDGLVAALEEWQTTSKGAE